MSKGWAYMGLVLAGGMMGAAVGLLAAPSSGDSTRRKLRDWLDEERAPQASDFYAYGMDDVYPLGMEAMPAPQAVWQSSRAWS